MDTRRILSVRDHRPWPVPNEPWVMRMRWSELLFAHWTVDPAVVRRLLPAGLELDIRDGRAWLGVVPFRMSDVAPRAVPALPGVSEFPELNLRTYVTAGGRPGVWFFSLDAANRLAVRVARTTFHLPYMDARMRCERGPGGVSYESVRTHRGEPPAALRATYRPVGPVHRSQPGSLEQWLTERYCLYSADRRGRIFRGEIHHEPWPLQPAEAHFEQLEMTRILGIELEPAPVHLLYVESIDVVAWRLVGI